MSKEFDVEFKGSRRTVVAATLLEDEAPIACENFWDALGEPYSARLHHGRHCAAELWCYLPPPKEEIPYENSTVFPEAGDILYYHFIQPPTRQGRWVFDLGIFYSRGQSRIAPGWIPGNLIARVLGGDEAIRRLELIASDLLRGESVEVILRRRAEGAMPEVTEVEKLTALESWLARLDDLPPSSSETDVTRACAAAEQFAHDLASWVGQPGANVDSTDRERLRAGARLVAELAAWWRFATDWPVPARWAGPAVSYWRLVVRHKVHGEPLPELG
jgi:hypothetical protein